MPSALPGYRHLHHGASRSPMSDSRARDHRDDQFPGTGVTRVDESTRPGTAHTTCASTRSPIPRSRSPPTRSSASRSTGLCGSDLHLYEVLGAFIDAGDILGHEPMGIVEAVGSEVKDIAPGDRVVVPFNISCGHCEMCGDGLAVAVRDDAGARVRHRRLAARLHEALRPGARAGRPSCCASRRRTTGRSRCPRARRTTASCFLSDVLPTAWQAVQYADVPERRLASRPRPRPDRRDGVPDRPAPRHRAGHRRRSRPRAPRPRSASHGVHDARRRGARQRPRRPGPRAHRRPRPALASSTRSAWRRTAHRSAGSRTASSALLPDQVAQKVIQKAAIDRLSALHLAIDLVPPRRDRLDLRRLRRRDRARCR